MAVALSPIGNDAPFLDANGDPLSGGKLYVYLAGSATPATTYQDSGGLTANANPVILNSNGYPASGGSVVEIWLTTGQDYLFELKTSADVTVWSRDDIEPINDVAASVQSQWVAGPTPTFVGTTSFTLVGDQTSTFHVGRRLQTTNTGGTIYSTITATAFTSLTTVTVENDSGTLDAGLSAVNYGLVTAANSSIPVRRDTIPLMADPTDPTKRLRIDVGNIPTATTVVQSTGGGGILPAGIGPLPYAGSSVPTGWLECIGTAVSRTTYAALFTAIGTTWGVGDGSTTFNLPDMRGKIAIGDGTGTSIDDGEDAEVDTGADTLTVPTNTNKWITGMSVVFTLASGTVTGLTSGNTYYVIRASATTVKLASSLANAQNGTAIDLTAKSSPVWDITHTYTARTLGQYGGAESKAMSSTENLSHGHTQDSHVHAENISDDGTSSGALVLNAGVASGFTIVTSADATGTRINTDGTVATNQATGGNAAMAIMNPFAVTKYIISY